MVNVDYFLRGYSKSNKDFKTTSQNSENELEIKITTGIKQLVETKIITGIKHYYWRLFSRCLLHNSVQRVSGLLENVTFLTTSTVIYDIFFSSIPIDLALVPLNYKFQEAENTLNSTIDKVHKYQKANHR